MRHIDYTHTIEETPRTILATGWSVSYRSGHGIDGVMLEVHRYNPNAGNVWGGFGCTIRYSMHDGREFQTKALAVQYALDAGLITEVQW